MSTDQNPYIGPRTYAEEEADLFFGREREAKDLMSLVFSDRLVLFYAQSGAGKSSLINTRLKPGLERQGFEVMSVARVSGNLPEGVGEVQNIFIFNLILSLDEREHPLDHLASLPLKDYLEVIRGEDETTGIGRDTRWVVIIDQFEEIFTTNLEHWVKREDFFKQIRDALEIDPRLWVIFSIREDYVAMLDPYVRYLPGRLRTRFYMRRLGYQAALEAIERPAEKGGRPFVSEAAQSLVDNLRQLRTQEQGLKPYLGEFVEPVQLQVVCFRLWENLNNQPPRSITQEDLKELGDVDRALGAFYEQTISEVVNETKISELELRHWIGDRLITEAGTRGMVFRGHDLTEGMPNQVVDMLGQKLLLRPEVKPGGRWYELVHDRFIQPILESNQAWRLRQPLLQAALGWQEANRPANLLLEGQTLVTALESNWQALGPVVEEFLNASKEAQYQREEQARQQENEQTRKLMEMEKARADALQKNMEAEKEKAETQKKFVRLMGVAFFIITILAGWAIWSSVEARRAESVAQREANIAATARVDAQNAEATAQANERSAVIAQDIAVTQQAVAEAQQAVAVANSKLARSRELASLSSQASDKTLAALLAIESVNVETSSESRSVLSYAVSRLFDVQRLSAYFIPRSGAAQPVWSPDEQYVLTSSNYYNSNAGIYENTVQIWNTKTGEENLHLDNVVTGTWLPEGHSVLARNSDNTVRIWDAETGEELLRLDHEETVTQAIWLQETSQILTLISSYDTELGSVYSSYLWDTETGESLPLPNLIEGIFKRMIWNENTHQLLALPFPQDEEAESPADSVIVWNPISDQVKSLSLAGQFISVSWGQTGRWLMLVSRAMDLNAESVTYTAQLWNFDSDEVDLLPIDGDYSQSAWNADDNWVFLLSYSSDTPGYTIQVWNVETKQAQSFLLEGELNQINWNSAGNRILVVSYLYDNETYKYTYSIQVWNVESGGLTTIPLEGEFFQVSWNPTGQWILLVSREYNPDVGRYLFSVQIWNPETEQTRSLKVAGEVSQAKWNDAGEQILILNRFYDQFSNAGFVIQIWDALNDVENSEEESGTELFHLQTGGEIVQAVWTPQGDKIFTNSRFYNSGGTSTYLQLWSGDTGEEQLRFVQEGFMSNLPEWTTDETLMLALNSDGIVRIWNLESSTDAPLPQFAGHIATVRQMRWSPSSTLLLTSSNDGTARVWNAATGVKEFVLDHQEYLTETVQVNNAVWSSLEDRILTVSTDGVRVWNLANLNDPTILFQLEAEGVTVLSASWNYPDENLILTIGSDGNARILDAQTGKEIASMQHSQDITQALWSGIGDRILTAGRDGTVQIWDIDQPDEPLYKLEIGSPGLSIAIEPEGNRLLTVGQDNVVRLWDWENGVEWNTGSGSFQFSHDGLINQVLWYPTGGKFITASADGTARVWDAQTGFEKLRLDVGGNVLQVDWIKESGQILTINSSGWVQIWDDQTGEEVLRFAPPGGASQAVMDRNQSRILIADRNGAIQSFDIELDKISASACDSSTRNMSVSEWFQNMGSREPYALTCPELGYYPNFTEAAQALISRNALREAAIILNTSLEDSPSITPQQAERLANAYNLICKRALTGIQDYLKEACGSASAMAVLSTNVKTNLQVCANKQVPSLAEKVQEACAEAERQVIEAKDQRVDTNLEICSEGIRLNLDDLVEEACNQALELVRESGDVEEIFNLCVDGTRSGLSNVVAPACQAVVDELMSSEIVVGTETYTQSLEVCNTGIDLGLDSEIIDPTCQRAIDATVASGDALLNFQVCREGLSHRTYSEIFLTACEQAVTFASDSMDPLVNFQLCTQGFLTNQPELFSETCDKTLAFLGEKEIKLETSVLGEILESGAQEVWWFSGNEGDVVRFRMDKIENKSELDAVVVLYRLDGEYLAEDDQTGGENNALLFYTLPDTGIYFIAARGWSTSTGAYELELTLEESP